MEKEWVFHPDYRLFGNAANYPGPRVEMPVSELGPADISTPPIQLKGQNPTERLSHFKEDWSLPKGPFSVEMWLVNHVNQPIGVAVSARGESTNAPIDWLLGYYGNEFLFGMDQGAQLKWCSAKVNRGWKRYWMHLVATYDGTEVKLYFNGNLKVMETIGRDRSGRSGELHLETCAYLANEPYMELANILKRLRITDRALSPGEIENRLKAYQEEVSKGILFPNLFHFTAGPYLHYATDTSINIGWETSERPIKTIVRYGEELPLSESKTILPKSGMEVAHNDCIQTTRLGKLKPSTPYFYVLEVINSANDTIKSGVLTFATAPAEAQPFTFAVIGDTEARPHINFRVAQLVWDERPNFVINLGDLTDGGKEPHKFEWTHEYFTGITPLASRIPFFPVAGNGESDLYWYNRYHQLPDPEAYYTFQYGDAQFFMLNSNERKEGFAEGGEQYVWLEEQLQKSDARWKFVCHHHAPYSSDENDYGDSWKEKSNLGDLKARAIVPLYEKYGVDIVFFGHLHTYQRTLPIFKDMIDRKNGVIYLQGGGAGGNLEDFTPNRSWFSAKTYRGHHYFTISLLQDELEMRMYDSEGRMKDVMKLKGASGN